MKYFQLPLLIASFFLISGCASKSVQSTNSSSKSADTYYWKMVSESLKSSLVCEGKVMPLRYNIYETNYSDLRKLLLKQPAAGSALNLDTTILTVPIPNGVPEKFAISQVQVLPPELSEKYPEIKTYHGKSLEFPEDNIRLDIAPKGISYMIMSTRGTIIMDPFCISDSVHVIVYFKKDLPEGAKENFEK